MIHFIYRYCRNTFSPAPPKALLFISMASRAIIILNLTLIGGFIYFMNIHQDSGRPSNTHPECKYSEIKNLPIQTERDIRNISCSVEKAIHSLENSSNSFIATFSPLIPIFALITATCIFLFNIVINTSKYSKYISYHITTGQELNRITGRIKFLNQNEISESILKVYFFDYRGKRCQVSEIPFIHRSGDEYTILARYEPLELNLLPNQADAVRSAPNKIDIAISATSGKIICVRGKEDWKPKQISKA